MRRYFELLIAMGVLAVCVAMGMGQTNSKGIFDDGSGSSPAAGGGEAQRAAVPDAAAVAVAMKQVETTYGEDLKNSARPQDMVFLSQKLQLLAGDDRDDAHCYAMLTKAKELAIAGGSYEQTSSVIDLTDERFDVDGPALKWDAVGLVAKTAGKDQQGELLAGVAKLANDAMGVDRYDIALSAAQWFMNAAPLEDVTSQALINQVQETHRAYEAIKPALATLATDPHNADANLAVGKFKSFFKGDWNGGLTMLAAGSDATLKGLASRELSGATDANAMMKLGDGWWDVAQQQSGIPQDKIQLHAATLYAQASEGLAGLDKAKVDKRVQVAMALHAKMSGTTALATSPAPAPEPPADSGGGSAPTPPPAPDSVTGPGPAPVNPAGIKSVTNSAGMKLVWIKPGTFMMGSPSGEPGRRDDEIQHKVTLTSGFYMAATDVTVGQFGAFVKDSGFKTDAETKGHAFSRSSANGGRVQGANWRHPGLDQTESDPVVDVSWDDAVAYCEWLSKKERKDYRLPTEAEWEYAARGGTQTAYAFGDDPGAIDDYAWSKSNSENRTHPVGLKKPNAWGLYDMAGDVWQWCADCYEPYSANAQTDPRGPHDPKIHAHHMVRGGSWICDPQVCRSASRMSSGHTDGFTDGGFRIVRNED